MTNTPSFQLSQELQQYPTDYPVQYNQPDANNEDELIDPVELAIALMNYDAQRQIAATVSRSAVATAAMVATGNSGNSDTAVLGILALGMANTPDDGAREFVELMLQEPSRITRQEFLQKYTAWKQDYEAEKRQKQREQLDSVLLWCGAVLSVVAVIVMLLII